MPQYGTEYRGIEEIVFVAYFNKPSSLPGFVAEFLWSNFLTACLDVGQQVYRGLQAIMEVAQFPDVGRKTVFRNVLTA
jgi:hypothetical protein